MYQNHDSQGLREMLASTNRPLMAPFAAAAVDVKVALAPERGA